MLQLLDRPGRAARFDRIRTALLAARRTRPQPGRDDKVVTAWNGLAITALAEAAVALGDPELLDAAQRCATALLDLHVVDGRLRRASLGGVVGDSAAILEDHAMLATGLLALYQLNTEEALADGGHRPAGHRAAAFRRPGAARPLVRHRRRCRGVGAAARRPDGRGDAVGSLGDRRGAADGRASGRQRPRRAVPAGRRRRAERASVLLARAPRSAGHWLAVAEAAVRGPLQIAVACEPASSLLAEARRLAPGGAIVVGGEEDSSALLAGRGRVDGADAAYVCRGRVCDLPVTDASPSSRPR